MIADIAATLCVDQQQRYAIGFSWAASSAAAPAAATPSLTLAPIHNVLGIGGGHVLPDKFVANNGCTKISSQEPAVGESGANLSVSGAIFSFFSRLT
ncbi:hypothetical protein MFIFM68171_02913 [Madurella fahalii]|uniref:Uncharacterized protein n=1 Tax=Madurella fahalii TaxID=1157608 RepID=A0ABQ0G4N3_9PEZI